MKEDVTIRCQVIHLTENLDIMVVAGYKVIFDWFNPLFLFLQQCNNVHRCV